MKIKNLFVAMLAGAAMVSCSNEDFESGVNNGAIQKGEQSFLAVNLSTLTRSADTPSFEAGSADENKVNDVAFFFFDTNGNAYDVATEGVSNRLDKGYEELTVNSGNVNVEEISKPVLLIEESKQVPPQKIVAVLNCPIEDDNISLAQLQAKVGAYNTITVGEKAYFVMSNSVYKNEATGEEVVATDIPALSISHNAEEALAHPVTIFVERVAAKVTVSTNYAEGKTSFNTGETTSENGTEIYAQVTGWEVVNAKTQAPLLKDIDATAWANFTWNWNDAANYRSYWAVNTADDNIIRSLSWDMANVDSRYYYENTDITNVDVATTNQLEGNQSYLLVKAQFVDAAGNSLAGKIAEWYGAKYTLAALKEQFANAVATQIYVVNEDGKTAESIQPADITFYQEDENASEKRYLCYATLTEDAAEKEFVSGVDEDGEFITMTVEEVNEILAGVRPAKIWEAGGYYYLPIAHNATVNGLVRNHVYQMNINGITGLGTPVYDPDMLITPEKPTEDASFISAEIQVLSWKVVVNNTVLQ